MAPPSSADGGGAPYLPFEGGRFRLAMGLMKLAPAAWIEINDRLAADLAAKRALLAARRDEVFAVLPEAEAPAAELLALLARHLPRHHADVFRRDRARLINRATGERWDLAPPALHPLELCGRLVQEDFCLMAGAGGPYRLVGASLCAPSRWQLADKIGRAVAAIHAPVPGYDDALASSVDRFFARLKPEKPAWRLNWTILDDPAPFQPVPRGTPAMIDAANAGAALWLRVERQTLRRLPATAAIVFTIRTHITRLDAAIVGQDQAAALAALLRDAPAATLAYKHITPFRTALLAWLDARAAGAGLTA
jgi:Haem-dependent oxidative N-demethylase, alpha subunit-like